MEIQRIRAVKGDEVEVRFATHDGYLWHPARILHVNADHVEVEYASGHRRRMTNDAEQFRALNALMSTSTGDRHG